MGTSTDGILAYGYDFGAEEALNLAEAKSSADNPYGYLKTAWWDEEAEEPIEGEELTDVMIRVLYESIAGAPPAESSEDRDEVVKTRLGVWFESHCSADYPMWILTTKVITADHGHPEVINLPDLAEGIDVWNERLAHALEVLGLTPTQERPEWLPCSDWG